MKITLLKYHSTAVLLERQINPYREADIVNRTKNLLKISASGRLTSWLLTRRRRTEFEITEHKY